MNYLSLVALYSLFNVLVQDKLGSRAAADVKSLSGGKPFGVFITLTRNSSVVHGCMGNWSVDFESVSERTVVSWVEQLAQDARWKDSRRLAFSKDLREDVSTSLEISVMQLPVIMINSTTAQLEGQNVFFNNQEYGVIVVGETGQRATFLPGVFPNETWSTISTQLLHKAGISTGTFYAYKTFHVRFSVYDLLFSAWGTYFLQQEVAMFYQKFYQDFIPYEFDAKTGTVTVELAETASVRNAACVVDVLHLSQKFREDLNWTQKPVLQNLDYYYKQWYKYEHDLTQTSIFLLQAYTLLLRGGVKSVQKRVALLEEGLYDLLFTLEPQFAMGEAVTVLAGLVNASTPPEHVDKLLKACDFMRNRLQGVGRRKRLDLVFELNWQSQSVYSMLQLSLPEHAPYFQAFVLELADMVLPIVSNASASALETNYLVVIYECLCTLEAALALAGYDVPVELRKQKLKFYGTLLEDRMGRFGLFYFKSGTVARLDLTGHALLINL